MSTRAFPAFSVKEKSIGSLQTLFLWLPLPDIYESKGYEAFIGKS